MYIQRVHTKRTKQKELANIVKIPQQNDMQIHTEQSSRNNLVSFCGCAFQSTQKDQHRQKPLEKFIGAL